MIKNWQVMPEVSRDVIKKFPDYEPVMLQLLFNRGLTEAVAMEKFLKPDYDKNLSEPSKLGQLPAAVELIIKEIKAGGAIIIYGDFDADGVTATALLYEILNIFKAKVDIYLPDRQTEGYGLNKKAVKQLAKKGTNLIITVDTGIRNKEEVALAENLGLEVIITDHHQAPTEKRDWPDCLIVNPAALEQPSEILAGVGVSFKLAQELIARAKLPQLDKEKLQRNLLDLVAVGTVADCVSLTGENRELVAEGLKVISQGRRPGLEELIKAAKINSSNDKAINSWQIGWQIAPRLNSAGRLGHANTAYQLLITKDQKQAESIASELNEKNNQRQKITEDIFVFCQKEVEQNQLNDKILILLSPNLMEQTAEKYWPEGVIGLVAGKLTEQYGRPAIVITKFKNEIKGSGRSILEFDITKSFELVSDCFSRFGGHAQAGGFTLKSREHLSTLISQLKQIAWEKLKKIDLKPSLMIEVEININEIDSRLMEKINKFEPFGQDNPRPVFLSQNLIIKDKIIMGQDGRHLKFRFNGLWALAFNQAENYKDYKIGDKVDMAYYLEFNDFNGQRLVQLKIIDIKSAKVNAA